MKPRSIQRLAPNGRDIRELPREELEVLVLELDDELTKRTQRITLLKQNLKEASAKTKKSEERAKNVVLDYINDPLPLHSNYGFNYAGKEAMEFIASKAPEGVERKDPNPIAGSYNAYIGGNKRIVSLKQKIGELQQQIIDTQEETQHLIEKRNKLKAILENLRYKENEPFKHKGPIPKSTKTKRQATFAKCRKLLQQLIANEKDPYRRDCYRCCYYLLKPDDRTALELFSQLYDPNLDQDTLKELQDILNDRNAHVAILKEQYKHLDARQEALRNAFLSLKDKMLDHVVDNDDDIQALKDRIAQLEQMIGKIPGLQEEIERLKKERDALLDEKDKLFKEGSDEASKLHADMMAKKAQLSEDRAGYDQERIQLEEVDQRLREQYATIVEEFRRLNDEKQKMAEEYRLIQARRTKMHDQLNQLAKAHIDDPSELRAVFDLSQKFVLGDLNSKHATIKNDALSKKDKYRNLYAECVKLQKILANKEMQEAAYRDRLKRAGAPVPQKPVVSEEKVQNIQQIIMNESSIESEEPKGKKGYDSSEPDKDSDMF
ncbi:hypothetical protein TVAG_380020 [Trichomonas vaginalis G3]|uniref:Uncharacterized protein n=1 Tax=Trichomonas vaginalis (strain ATCC PRA-98 / G3) TaxID=412133 RepID=A2DXE0_TRIV3|nr:hypothetical protein TVAGG3_0925600 [Trichomonas vaginalis G3]EAY14892.1 hypothetical protein TVAG_380020 [Trichomonas vaginalis G3]KAI5485449.1 hypothetical protein TVAGG3_0925600 [Trichomonas vaginalis G3]|eukprot:XP_001327115.1 hypothetical protein [Trichomonas vaginalis G3]